ncbi:MAG TPA: phosphatase [Gammaproteobacteria bacterium]|nr:phosphatase [Gammaproteobacteria bacterium]
MTAWRQWSAGIASAGQPSVAQLGAVAAAGYGVVINLALHDAPYSLPDEPATVTALGMAYVHIPVIWTRPTAADLHVFFAAMNEHRQHRRFVHCARNMRASVFVALYRFRHEGRAKSGILADIRTVWEPDAVWTAFLHQALAAVEGERGGRQ